MHYLSIVQLNATTVAVMAIFHHIYYPNYPEPMEDDGGTFVIQFLSHFNSATDVVNPLNMYRALIREHLGAMNFHEIMTQYQAVELYLDAFEDSPAITGRGNDFFNFMAPTIAEYSIVFGCRKCGINDNETDRQVFQCPYFIQQLDEIPAEGNLATTFASRFQGMKSFLLRNYLGR